jgi:hypothetical protein
MCKKCASNFSGVWIGELNLFRQMESDFEPISSEQLKVIIRRNKHNLDFYEEDIYIENEFRTKRVSILQKMPSYNNKYNLISSGGIKSKNGKQLNHSTGVCIPDEYDKKGCPVSMTTTLSGWNADNDKTYYYVGKVQLKKMKHT